MVEKIIEQTFEVVNPNGVFAVLFVILLGFVLWNQNLREKKYQRTIEDQNLRENQYQIMIRDYQSMTKKHQDIINTYNKKELNFQNIIQQLMNQIPLKIREEFSVVEDEVGKIKDEVTSIKHNLEIDRAKRNRD